MAGIRLNRAARNRWQTIAVWAMLPLAVINSRTVYGCGCTGHFESTCHCNCCNSHGKCAKCGGGSSTCPCCSKVGRAAPAEDSKPSDGATGFRGHHCKGVAVHEAIPATVVSVHTGVDLNLSLDLDTIDLPIVVNQLAYRHDVSALLTAPPDDLVVTLRRLVI